jgi:carboxymethylenebutenolidase
VTDEDVTLLQRAAQDSGKSIDVKTYEGAPHAFFDESRKDSYRPEAAQTAWTSTVAFLAARFQG